MKAITLWQPYASAMAMGFKTHETRTWPAPRTVVGETVAIHAAKSVNRKAECAAMYAAREALVKMGATADLAQFDMLLDLVVRDVLPRGAVVATGRVSGWFAADWLSPTPLNSVLGNYAQGRFAWQFDEIEPLVEPVPASGKQGIWNWEL